MLRFCLDLLALILNELYKLDCVGYFYAASTKSRHCKIDGKMIWQKGNVSRLQQTAKQTVYKAVIKPRPG